MLRAERIRNLLDEYARQRQKNVEELQEREREAYQRDPELEALRGKSISVAIQAMRAGMQEPSLERRRAIAENMRAKGLLINGEMRARLLKLGLAEDSLEEKYRCEVCRDSGYVGDAPARFCECFERKLTAGLQLENAVVGQTFENFREDFVPEANGQREKLVQARKALEEFANTYPDARWHNIVLMGEGGLGKSFLLNCVYDRVTRNGHPAARITAFRMFESMRKRHMGAEEADDGYTQMLETPLLLIDDLGTEPVMRNITVEYLFTLLNERMESGLYTMITTNLNPAQLSEKYGERVFSRLFGKPHGLAVKLEGKDLRLHGRR